MTVGQVEADVAVVHWVDFSEACMQFVVRCIPESSFGDYCPPFDLFVELIKGEPSQAAVSWSKTHLPGIENTHHGVAHRGEAHREAFRLLMESHHCELYYMEHGDAFAHAHRIVRTVFTISE